MGTWQLFVDEPGDFSSRDDLAIAGVLLQGYASQQLSISLRSVLERIFVGVPCPPHAAHYNYPSARLWGPLRERAPQSGPSGSRFTQCTAGALNIARRSTATEAAEFRSAVQASTSVQKLNFVALRNCDRWLLQFDTTSHQDLGAETEQHRADLVAFLAKEFATQLGSRAVALVGAWRPGALEGAPRNANGDDDYVGLYEALLERVLAFVASRDSANQPWVHVAPRGWSPPSSGSRRLDFAHAGALQHHLVLRAAHQPSAMRALVHEYDDRVHPGTVLAANRLRSRILAPAQAWSEVMASVQTTIGLCASTWCHLVSKPSGLPASGDHTGKLSGPLWARQQASAWIEALRG